jgi:MFS family permease
MARLPQTSNSKSQERRKFTILLTTSLVCSLIMLDANVVAVSLPTIARSLGASFTDIEWVVSAYVLPFAAMLLAAGSYADRHGRKRTMLVGLAVFAFASGLCGLTHSALMLNLARALQGIGASLLLTAGLAVINHAFIGQERARAYAFWGACIGIAITSGPIIGGAITGFLGWRWTFLVNLPLCAVLFVTSVVSLEESRDHEAKNLDIAGILTLSSGFFLLIWALIDGNSIGWGTPAIIWPFVTATGLLISFVVVELNQARPMVDLALFAQPTFLGSVFAMLGYAGGAQVMIFYLPMYPAKCLWIRGRHGGSCHDPVCAAHVSDSASRWPDGEKLFRPRPSHLWSHDDSAWQPPPLWLRTRWNELSHFSHRHVGGGSGRWPP